VDPFPETDPGVGTFSSIYAVLDVQTDGPQQIVTLGDLPFNTTDDWSFALGRLVHRGAVVPLSIPSPTLSGHTVMQVGQSAGQGGGRLTIVDSNSQIRVDIGNLPIYTDPSGVVSPSENGIRLMDASGLLLFDPVGIVGVGNNLGASGQGPGQIISSTTYITTTPAITFNFTLSRQVRCFFLGGAQGHIQTGTGIGYVRIAVYNVTTGALVASTGDAKMNSTGTLLSSVGGIALLTGANSVQAIGPGIFTAQIETKVDSGSTFYFDNGELIGIGFGA
jgi:hypothetical protein